MTAVETAQLIQLDITGVKYFFSQAFASSIQPVAFAVMNLLLTFYSKPFCSSLFWCLDSDF